MPRLLLGLLLGLLAGLLLAALTLALGIRFLPNLLVVGNAPEPADAIVVLGGDNDGSRLRTGLQLHDDKLAPHLILVGAKNKDWDAVVRRSCPDCKLEGRGAILLEGSLDTRTDAEISLKYCRANNLSEILVVTSPYHTRRAQFIFNDVADNLKSSDQLPVTGDQSNPAPKAPEHQSLITDHAFNGSPEVTVISSGDYGKLVPPSGRWWMDRRTLEFVWLELGKILYWELTPFMEFQGEGEKLKEREMAK